MSYEVIQKVGKYHWHLLVQAVTAAADNDALGNPKLHKSGQTAVYLPSGYSWEMGLLRRENSGQREAKLLFGRFFKKEYMTG